MIALAVLAGVFVAVAGAGALIYHVAHKTTLGSSISSQVAAAAASKVTELLGQTPKQ